MKKQTIILLSVLLQLTPALVDINNIEIPEEKLDDTDSESGGNKNYFFLSAQRFLHNLFIFIILYKLQLFCLSFFPFSRRRLCSHIRRGGLLRQPGVRHQPGPGRGPTAPDPLVQDRPSLPRLHVSYSSTPRTTARGALHLIYLVQTF